MSSSQHSITNQIGDKSLSGQNENSNQDYGLVDGSLPDARFLDTNLGEPIEFQNPPSTFNLRDYPMEQLKILLIRLNKICCFVCPMPNCKSLPFKNRQGVLEHLKQIHQNEHSNHDYGLILPDARILVTNLGDPIDFQNPPSTFNFRDYPMEQLKILKNRLNKFWNKFVCPVPNCKSLPFKDRKGVLLHVKQVHQGEHVKCESCQRKFATKQTLKNHQESGRCGLDILHCPLEECQEKFSGHAKRQNFNSHVFSKHIAPNANLHKLLPFFCLSCKNHYTNLNNAFVSKSCPRKSGEATCVLDVYEKSIRIQRVNKADCRKATEAELAVGGYLHFDEQLPCDKLFPKQASKVDMPKRRIVLEHPATKRPLKNRRLNPPPETLQSKPLHRTSQLCQTFGYEMSDFFPGQTDSNESQLVGPESSNFSQSEADQYLIAALPKIEVETVSHEKYLEQLREESAAAAVQQAKGPSTSTGCKGSEC